MLPKEEGEDGEDLVDLPRGHSQQELPDDAWEYQQEKLNF